MTGLSYYVWAIAGVVLLLSETMIPGFFIFFFGLGALLVGLLSVLGLLGTLNAQLVVFIVSSVVMLVLLRKWMKNIFKGFFADKTDAAMNLNEYVGKTVVVRAAIAKDAPGKVEFNGSDWQAESEDTLSPGERAVIVAHDNLTLKVVKK